MGSSATMIPLRLFDLDDVMDPTLEISYASPKKMKSLHPLLPGISGGGKLPPHRRRSDVSTPQAVLCLGLRELERVKLARCSCTGGGICCEQGTRDTC